MTAVLHAQGGSTAVFNSGATFDNPLGNAWFSSSSGYGGEARARLVYRAPGTISHLWANVAANTLNASSTLRVRKGGANVNGVITINSSTTGLLEDTSNTDAVVAADQFNTRYDNTGASSGSITLRSSRHKFAATTNTVTRLSSAGTGTISLASNVGWHNLAGNQDSLAAGEVSGEQYFGVGGTLKNGAINTSSNGRTTNTTVISRKGGANGNISITITASTSGYFEDTSNSDTIASTNLANWQSTTGTGTGSTTLNQMASDFEATDSTGVIFVGKHGTGFTISAGTTRYGAIGGSTNTLVTTENEVRINAAVDFTASHLSTYASANTILAPSTLTLRQNNASTSLTVTYPTNTSGRFTDTTHTVSVVAADNLDYEYVGGGASNSVTVKSVSLSASYGAAAPATRVQRLMLLGVG